MISPQPGKTMEYTVSVIFSQVANSHITFLTCDNQHSLVGHIIFFSVVELEVVILIK